MPDQLRWFRPPWARRDEEAAARAERDRRRHSAPDRFRSGRKWKKFSRWFRARHPLCEICGRVTEVVHHVQSVADRPDLALVESNCQALCNRCHSRLEREIQKGGE